MGSGMPVSVEIHACRLRSLFVQAALILLVVVLICCGSPRANAYPTDSQPTIGAVQAAAIASSNKQEQSAPSSLVGIAPSRMNPSEEHPLLSPLMDPRHTVLSTKWLELQSRIITEQDMLAACRSGDGNCSAAARRFLSIVELGRMREGRARLGEINRAVNLSIKPVSDLAQYGIADYWSAPLATLGVGAGDCEDYAVVKYAALRELGVDPDDLRLVVVSDIKRKTLHAV